MAEALAAYGAKVALVGRNAEKAAARIEKIAKTGGVAWFESCNADKKSELEELLKRVVAKEGRVDILVNGAGVNSATPFLDIPEEEIDRIFAVNVKGVMLACQVFGRYFVENKIRASIINMGSESGVVPLSRVFTYSASKAAVHNISKNLAREWAPMGIRVNTLVPGFFPAEQNRKILQPERIEKIMAHTAMGRFGEAHELGGATVLLASDAASFITGSELVVDGGYSAMTI
jgi:NAD(P)-dependent dehydrogenase (short-subunit alcohol dehydrogenase family)